MEIPAPTRTLPDEQTIPNPNLESSTHAVLLEIRDLLSTLHPKASAVPPSMQPDLRPQAQDISPARMPRFGDLSNFWDHFDAATKEESDLMINGMKDNLDNLLIFVCVPAPELTSLLTNICDFIGSLVLGRQLRFPRALPPHAQRRSICTNQRPSQAVGPESRQFHVDACRSTSSTLHPTQY